MNVDRITKTIGPARSNLGFQSLSAGGNRILFTLTNFNSYDISLIITQIFIDVKRDCKLYVIPSPSPIKRINLGNFVLSTNNERVYIDGKMVWEIGSNETGHFKVNVDIDQVFLSEIVGCEQSDVDLVVEFMNPTDGNKSQLISKLLGPK